MLSRLQPRPALLALSLNLPAPQSPRATVAITKRGEVSPMLEGVVCGTLWGLSLLQLGPQLVRDNSPSRTLGEWRGLLGHTLEYLLHSTAAGVVVRLTLP